MLSKTSEEGRYLRVCYRQSCVFMEYKHGETYKQPSKDDYYATENHLILDNNAR